MVLYTVLLLAVVAVLPLFHSSKEEFPVEVLNLLGYSIASFIFVLLNVILGLYWLS